MAAPTMVARREPSGRVTYVAKGGPLDPTGTQWDPAVADRPAPTDTQEEVDAFVSKHGPRSWDPVNQRYKSVADTIADRRRGHDTDAPPIFVDDTSSPNRHTETGYSRKLNPFYSDALSEQMQHRLASKPLSLRQAYAAFDNTLTRSNPEFEDQGSAAIPQRTPEQNAAFDQITQHRARERALDNRYGEFSRPTHSAASLPFYMQYDPSAQEYADTRPGGAPASGSQRRGLPTPATSSAGQAPTAMPTAMPTPSGSYADRAQASMPTSSGSYSSGSYSSVPESMTPSWMRNGSAPAPAPAPASTGHNGLLPALDREHSSVPEHLMPSWLRGRSSGESDMIPPAWRGGTGG